jgi:hypothetical protein
MGGNQFNGPYRGAEGCGVLHRLGGIAVNHFNQPYRVTDGVRGFNHLQRMLEGHKQYSNNLYRLEPFLTENLVFY